MSLIVDADVEAVAEFMQKNIAATRLLAVADGIAAMAPLLWGTYATEPVQALRLEASAIPAERTPATST